MSPQTREWPPYLRRLAKLCLSVIYLGTAFAGLHVTITLAHSAWWSVTLGVWALTASSTAWGLMLAERWMLERIAANLAGLALALYAGVNTIRLALPDGADPGGTALLYVATAAVGLRAIHLAAFDYNLNGAKRAAGRAQGPGR